MSQGRVAADDQSRDWVVRMSPRKLPNTYGLLSPPAHSYRRRSEAIQWFCQECSTLEAYPQVSNLWATRPQKPSPDDITHGVGGSGYGP